MSKHRSKRAHTCRSCGFARRESKQLLLSLYASFIGIAFATDFTCLSQCTDGVSIVCYPSADASGLQIGLRVVRLHLVRTIGGNKVCQQAAQLRRPLGLLKEH